MGESKLSPINIRIKQFQSIEDLEIEVKGLTVITGRTNVGKSAIMRAISSATLGSSVIGLVRKGAQYCSVEMSSKDWGFRWEKGEKGINRYIIGDTTYDKPGQKQLEEIIKMGFGSVKLGSKEVQPWWSPQFFPIFLLGETGPALTDFISEVSRLTVLQDAIVLSSRGKKRANDSAKEKANEAKKLRDRLTLISGVDQMIKICKELEDQKNSIEDYHKYIEIGNELYSRLLTSVQRISALESISSVKIPKDDAEETSLKLSGMHAFWNKLETIAKRIISLKPSEKMSIPEPPIDEWTHLSDGRKFVIIDHLKKKDDTLDGIRNVSISPLQNVDTDLLSIRAMGTLLTRLESSAESIKKLSLQINIPESPDGIEQLKSGQEILTKLNEANENEAALEDKMVAIDKELDQINIQLAAIPSCPSCGRPIPSAEHKNHAISL